MVKTFSVTLCLSILSSCLMAQSTITGRIKSNDEYLQGVSVSVSGMTRGTITDSLGRYTLRDIPSGKQTLHFSFTGYETIDTTIEVDSPAIELSLQMQVKGETLDEVIIVSSARTNSRIEDLPTKVEVLGSEEVHEENGIKPGNIASLLGDIAGIQIQPTNAATGNADMRIQGLQGKYTQILRDGMPLFGGYSGSFGILQIPPLDLEQIELIKGSSSTLYGGGAIAGLVNLISRKPKMNKPVKNITVNVSTLKEFNANAFLSARNKKYGYTLFAGTTQQKATDVDHDGFSDVPKVKSGYIHPRFFIYGNHNAQLALGYTLTYEDRKGGDLKVLSGRRDVDHQFFIQNVTARNTFDAEWEKKSAQGGRVTVKGNASLFNKGVTTPEFGTKLTQKSWYSEAAYSKKSNRHNWVAGINFNGDNFKKLLPDSTLIPKKENMSTVGVFVQDDWKWSSKLIAQAGFRLDHNNLYGDFALPRLSLLYKASPHLTLRGGGGLGYKTPTLFTADLDERAYRYLTGYNPFIKPERSMGVNVDLNYKDRWGDWDITINESFFHNRINNPIYLLQYFIFYRIESTYTNFYTFFNSSGTTYSTGLETYIQATKGKMELYLGHVYTDARQNNSFYKSRVPLIARNKLATVIAYEFNDHFRAGIESSYTGKQQLSAGSTVRPYWFTAAMFRYTVGKASFVLNGENLLDERQNKRSSIVLPNSPSSDPQFQEIWAPIDGRVVNLSLLLQL